MTISSERRRDLTADDIGEVFTAGWLDYADVVNGMIVLAYDSDLPADAAALQYLRNQWHQVGRIGPIGNILQYAYASDDLFTLVWLP